GGLPFFFQAEDGIRGFHVTGVQTCALPISDKAIQVSLERHMECAIGRCGHGSPGSALVCREGTVADWERAAPLLSVAGPVRSPRSEERRVGKACRSLWTPDQCRKKQGASAR